MKLTITNLTPVARFLFQQMTRDYLRDLSKFHKIKLGRDRIDTIDNLSNGIGVSEPRVIFRITLTLDMKHYF